MVTLLSLELCLKYQTGLPKTNLIRMTKNVTLMAIWQVTNCQLFAATHGSCKAPGISSLSIPP